VLARTESYLNDVPAIQSSKLELDREYTFKTVLKGRVPGKHHFHPMINVEGAGPLLGPGSWLTVEGRQSDFVLPATTVDGTKIDNLETVGTRDVFLWHGFWVAVGAFWLIWWLRRPLLVTRYAATEKGHEDKLVTRTDMIVGLVMAVGSVVVVVVGAEMASAKYPNTIPLQAGRAQVEPLPAENAAIKVKVVRATYDVPGRSMKLALQVTNTGNRPIALGEFTTAGLRFVNRRLPAALAGVDKSYPAELIAKTSLAMDDERPIAPKETRLLHAEATDAAWEVERLTSLMRDPDNRVGGLLFFFDPAGNRTVIAFSGPIIPVFKKA